MLNLKAAADFGAQFVKGRGFAQG